MKGNKGKEVAGEGNCPEAGDTRPDNVPQTRPSTGDKRKSLPKNLDLGSLPSHYDKRVKHSIVQGNQAYPAPTQSYRPSN